MPDEDDDTQRPMGRPARPVQRLTEPRSEQPLPGPEQPKRSDPERRRRRESFLADLDEAQHLLARVAPRRTRLAQLRQQQLLRTYLH